MITIDYLKNHPQHIPALAKMWADTIGQRWVPHISSEDAITRFQTHLNSDELPLTIIAYMVKLLWVCVHCAPQMESEMI